MQSVTHETFGPLIAYLVPGATVLAGWAPFVPVVNRWMGSTAQPGIDGVLVLSLVAIGAGMTVSAIRWALVDRFHSLTGLVPPALDFANLHGRVEEFQLLIEIHYRHYQFYANMLVAVAIGYLGYRLDAGWTRPGPLDFGVLFVEPVFLLASRDTLRKYYARTAQLFSHPSSRE